MAEVPKFSLGGYRYLKAVFQYSGGVAAEPGFAIHRARLGRPLPLAQGLKLAEAHLAAIGRPSTAFCACELRSAEPFTEHGFIDFNRMYVQTLERWGIYRDGVNPVARTNVCPEYDKPQVPSLYAFSYTVPASSKGGSFIVAGSGEAPEGQGSYHDRIVRRGDTSREGLREKVHDIGALVRDEIVGRGAAPGGLAWHFCRPPVVGLDFEMDVRGAVLEVVIHG
jgi:hypothetical protein